MSRQQQQQSIKLPTIDDAEFSGEEGELKSIQESLVLLQSLRQSRERLLSSFFTKFSGKQQKKAANPPIAPHTIQSRGRCDLSIGPHIFHDTTIHEVHYLHAQVQQPAQPRQWQTYYPTSNYQAAPIASTSTAQIPPTPPPAPPMSALAITPEVVNQVNLAASTNPTLANLLQLAAGGKASPDQLKTLGLLIQSLAANAYAAPAQPPNVTNTSMVVPPSSAAGLAQASTAMPNPKPFDIVFEFKENSSERWILPRGVAVFSSPSTTSSTVYSSSASSENITITAIAPRTRDENSTTKEELVTIHITKSHWTIRDTVQRWAAISPDQVILDKLAKEESRRLSHPKLAYQIPENSQLLTQLQTITAPPYTLKSIQPTGNATTTASRKRAPRKRKATPTPATPVQSVLAPQLPPPDPLPEAHDPTEQVNDVSAPVPPTTLPSTNIVTSTSTLPTSNAELPPLKKVKQRQPKARQPQLPRPPIVIKCLSCGMTDVPLLMGGRFCRPCVSAGKVNAEIPQVASARGQGMNTYRANIQTLAPVWVAESNVAPATAPAVATPSGSGTEQLIDESGTTTLSSSSAVGPTSTAMSVTLGDKGDSSVQMSTGAGSVTGTSIAPSMLASGQEDIEMASS